MLNAMRVSRTTEVEVPGLAEKIRLACKLTDKSMRQVCAEAEISTQFLYDVRNGKAAGMKIETLRKLEKALDTNFGVNFPD